MTKGMLEKLRDRFVRNVSALVLSCRDQYRHNMAWTSSEAPWPVGNGPCTLRGPACPQMGHPPEWPRLLQLRAGTVWWARSCSPDGGLGGSQRTRRREELHWAAREALRAHSRALGCSTRACRGPCRPRAGGENRHLSSHGPHVYSEPGSSDFWGPT